MELTYPNEPTAIADFNAKKEQLTEEELYDFRDIGIKLRWSKLLDVTYAELILRDKEKMV